MKSVFTICRNPENNIPLEKKFDIGEYKGSSVAFTKLNDGRYMLVVDHSDADPLNFYLSKEPGSLDFKHMYAWYQNKEPLSGGDWMKYHNLNLVTECGTKDLYMIGTGNTHETYGTGNDRAQLFLIETNKDTEKFIISKKGDLHMYCDDPCNFNAGGGVYVDPNHQLILYATEFGNDGPKPEEGSSIPRHSSIEFKEFRSVPHIAKYYKSYIDYCDDIQNSWVELYDDPGYTDRNLMIDYIDRNKEFYYNYKKVEGFNDKPSSVRYCIAKDWSLYMFQHTSEDGKSCPGRMFPLTGTGSYKKIADLDRGYFEDISCSCFIKVQDEKFIVKVDQGKIYYYNRPVCKPGDQSSSRQYFPTETGELLLQIEAPAGAFAQETTITHSPLFPPSHSTLPLVSPGIALSWKPNLIRIFSNR